MSLFDGWFIRKANPDAERNHLNKILQDIKAQLLAAIAGGVNTVQPGTGIDVDSTDSNNPIVSVESGIVSGAAAGATALQPGDNVSELVNDEGYARLQDANTWDDTQTVYNTAGGRFEMDGPQLTVRGFDFLTEGSLRWRFVCGGPAESGSDAGSNFACISYSDAGSPLGSAFTIGRATRKVSFSVVPSVGGTDLAQLTQTISDGDTTHSPSADVVFDTIAGLSGTYQPLDATLTALSGQNWALNALPIGSGTDTVSQVAFAANTFPARASTGDLVAKTITDDALLLLADADVPRAGTPNTWSKLQTINENANPGSAPVPQAGTQLHMVQDDGVPARQYVNAWGSSCTYQGVRGNNTAVSPTTLIDNDVIVSFAAAGYDGASYSNAMAQCRLEAAGTWTTTSRPTKFRLTLVPTGSTSLVPVVLADAGNFASGVNNTINLGAPSFLWKEVFAGVGSINMSDARMKTEVRPFTAAELAAALALSDEVGFFRFLDAVEKKGEAAREHCGTTVQRAIEIMEAHGLDPFGYGFICYDEWDAKPEHLDEETGNVLCPAREAGSLYSFRPDQLDRFIAKGVREKQRQLESRIAALESKWT